MKPYSEIAIKVPRFEEAKGFYTSKARSRIMARIKGKNTKSELVFRRALWKAGVRFRVHCKDLPGKPDVSNKTHRFVVFIDGEFWHGFNWSEKKKTIKSNRGFWLPKIERNIQRDRVNDYKLLQMGYVVFRFWEKEITKDVNSCVKQVLNYVEISKYN